jgi:hypothetical protein
LEKYLANKRELSDISYRIKNYRVGWICSLVIIPISVISGIMTILYDEVFIGIIILISGLFCGIVGFFYNKYRDNKLQGEKFRPLPSDDGFYPEVSNELTANRRDATIQTNVEKTMNPQESFIFKRKNIDEVIPCMICKLEIRDQQIVFQCPNCLSYFHVKHLNEWLAKNNDCPVCNVSLRD